MANADDTTGADQQAIRSAKALLRRAILLRRELRDTTVRQADDAARFAVVVGHLHDQPPRTVAAYLSNGSEPGTLQLVGWLAAQDVRVLLPVLTGSGGPPGEPAWAPYAGPDALRVGPHSILEPTTAVLPSSAVAEVELVICAALAANSAGDRLGRGGGWYDRALPQITGDAPVWALLNDDEVLDTIPTESWDRPVDAIVTPSALLTCAQPDDVAPPAS